MAKPHDPLARDFRLIPIVLFATISLLALKVSGLVFDGGYTLAERMQARYKTDIADHDAGERAGISARSSSPTSRANPAQRRRKQPWAQEMFNFNDVTKRRHHRFDRRGRKAERPGPQDQRQSRPTRRSSKSPARPSRLSRAASPRPGERAVLERLQTRRQELDTRNRELEMRESLLKAAEKRLEDKVTELKDTEGRVNTAMGTRDKMEAQRFKSIVSMYENMKAKDAARIFDRLDLKILVDVSTQINPRKMSEILAQMSSEAAERLTVELANRASAQPKTQSPDQLPKIEGKPAGTDCCRGLPLNGGKFGGIRAARLTPH